MKIVYCTNSIGTKGGIERVTIQKANALSEIEGNQVWIVFTDIFEFPKTIHPLSPKVNTFNLNICHWDDQYSTKWQRFIQPKIKFLKHLYKMQQFVNRVKPDIVISVGQSEKFVLPLIRNVPVLIREIHFNSNYRYYTALENGMSKFRVKISNYIDYKIICRFLYDRTFLLTKQDKKENFPNDQYIEYMHNPLSFTVDKIKNEDYCIRKNIIISVGRLNWQKDFPALIRSWANIEKKYPDWELHIVGEGPERSKLEELINELNLKGRVKLCGFSYEVRKELKQASIFALTSLSEGFALVLTEAHSCGLPIVSFDFKYGVQDIILNGKNGFIIGNRNEKEFSEKLSLLIENKELRLKMSCIAKDSSLRFDASTIAQQWQKKFEDLMNKKGLC